MTAVPATTPQPTVPTGRVLPTAAVAAEWSKLFSLRTTRRTMLASLILSVAIAALFLVAIDTATGTPLAQTPTFSVVTASLLGVDATALLILVMAAGMIGSEYGNGMIRTTLTAVPGRSRLLAAKAVVLAVVGYGIGVLAGVLAFFTGQGLLMAAALPTASVTDPAVVKLILGSALGVPVYALFGLAFAFVFRATGGGIVAGLVVVFLPTVLGWLSGFLGEGLIAYLPTSAIHSLSGLTETADPTFLSPLPAALTLVVWVLATLALADRLLSSRDA